MTGGSALKAARTTSSAGRCGRRLLRDRCDACLGPDPDRVRLKLGKMVSVSSQLAKTHTVLIKVKAQLAATRPTHTHGGSRANTRASSWSSS